MRERLGDGEKRTTEAPAVTCDRAESGRGAAATMSVTAPPPCRSPSYGFLCQLEDVPDVGSVTALCHDTMPECDVTAR